MHFVINSCICARIYVLLMSLNCWFFFLLLYYYSLFSSNCNMQIFAFYTVINFLTVSALKKSFIYIAHIYTVKLVLNPLPIYYNDFPIIYTKTIIHDLKKIIYYGFNIPYLLKNYYYFRFKLKSLFSNCKSNS